MNERNVKRTAFVNTKKCIKVNVGKMWVQSYHKKRVVVSFDMLVNTAFVTVVGRWMRNVELIRHHKGRSNDRVLIHREMSW